MGESLADVQQALSFVTEIERLKNVLRKTKPVGLDRFENSAEHSWHVTLTALMLQSFANEKVDIFRVIKMLLIHDLGEIDAGDKIIYASETPEQKNKEAEGVKRILNLLPGHIGEDFFDLWVEFEKGDTTEARYARAIDRIPPLLHNFHGDGHSWRNHQITKEQVLDINQRIAWGSEKLWQYLSAEIEEKASQGYFNHQTEEQEEQ